MELSWFTVSHRPKGSDIHHCGLLGVYFTSYLFSLCSEDLIYCTASLWMNIVIVWCSQGWKSHWMQLCVLEHVSMYTREGWGMIVCHDSYLTCSKKLLSPSGQVVLLFSCSQVKSLSPPHLPSNNLSWSVSTEWGQIVPQNELKGFLCWWAHIAEEERRKE